MYYLSLEGHGWKPRALSEKTLNYHLYAFIAQHFRNTRCFGSIVPTLTARGPIQPKKTLLQTIGSH